MSKNKKLLMAMGTMAFAAMLISAGTFALFTGEAANEGNTFTAGTIELDITSPGGGQGLFQLENIAPGDSGFSFLHVTNSGSLDVWMKVGGIKTNGELFAGSHPVQLTYSDRPVVIRAGSTTSFKIDWRMPLEAGNEYLGKSGEATIVIDAVQYRNNEDRDNIKWGN